MQEKARVVAIEGDIVSVVPLEIEACINCNNTECKKNGNIFKAVNRRGFSLQVGSHVRIAAPAGQQLAQGLLMVGLPVALSAAAFAIVSVAAPSAGENVRVLAALCALAAGAVGMLLIFKPGKSGLPEVVEVF